MSSSLADIVTEYPYPGLRPFEPHEADIFFGRKRHVTDLLTRLNSRRFLAVVGPSGCGKSSLIRAGLIPALQAGFMARSKFQWNFAVFRPGNQPLLRLATALCDSGVFGEGDTDVAPDPEQLREDLEASSRSLANRLSLNEYSQGTNLLILVDQFEELFRFEREGGGDESRALVNLLLETARDTEVSAYVVITMRTDFLGHCPVFTGLPEALNDSQYLTPRLKREQIEEAVVGPARMFNGEVGEDVVAHILNEMGTDPDQLPLMQHLLMRMWRRATGGDSPTRELLTMDDYKAAGGLAEALSKHVETVFSQRLASDRERELAEQMFRRLTDVAPNGQLVRRSPAPEFSGLCDQLNVDDDNELRAVIDTFRVEGRSFLMPPPAEELKPDTPIDISHESLIRNWPRLQEWTREEARAAKVRREIGKDAAAWDAAGRKSDDATLPESRLVAALAWSEDANPCEVSPQIRDFLEACVCRRDEARRKDQELEDARRKKRSATGFASVFLTVALTAGWFWHQRGMERDSILAERYWRDAAQQFQGHTADNGDDLVIGLLWLAEAYSKEPKRDSSEKKELYEIRVGAALAQHPKLRELWQHEGLRTMAASRDGKYVLTAGTRDNKHDLRFWNVDDGKQLDRQPCNFQVNAVEFSGEGNDLYLLAAMGKKADAKGELAVWHWPDPQHKAQLCGDKALTDSGPVLAATFLPARGSSSKPGVVAIVQASSATTKIMLWRALDEASVELKAADDKTAVAATAVRKLTVSDDGRLVAAWGDRDAINIWNVTEQAAMAGNLLLRDDTRKWEKPTELEQVVFSHNGGRLATVDREGLCRVWNTSSGKLLFDWSAHDGAATFVAFGPNDCQLVTAGEVVAKFWDLDSNARKDNPNPKLKFEFPHQDKVVSIKFSPDGRRVATASQDRTVRVWDVATGLPAVPRLHHAFPLSSIEFSADGYLMTRTPDTVQIWGLAGENLPPQLLLQPGDQLMNASNSDDGTFVATISRNRVQVWDVLNERHTLSGQLTHSVDRSWISNDGRRALTVVRTATSEHDVQLWDDESEQPRSLKTDGLGAVGFAAFSSDGKLVLTASADPGPVAGSVKSTKSPLWQIQLWNTDTGEPLLAVPARQRGPVNHAAWSKQGTYLVISTGNESDWTEMTGVAQLWNWDGTKKQLVKDRKPWKHKSQHGSSNAVRFAAFSPDGQLVVTGGADDAAYLWNVTTDAALSPGLKHDSDIVHATFSKDGKQLATTSIRDNKSCVWDVEEIRALAAKASVDAEKSVDAKYTFQHRSRINRAVFSWDDKLLATVSNDGTAQVWSLASGDLAAVLKHDAPVQTACFTKDGSRLRTVSYIESGVGNGLSDRPPQRWEWRLKADPRAKILLQNPDKLRDYAQLLAASRIDPQRGAIQPFSSESSAVAEKMKELWTWHVDLSEDAAEQSP